MIFCNLGSGSKGNSHYICGDRRGLLIDQGFSLKNLLHRMESAGLDPHNVAGLLLTHEHADHLRGVGLFARRFRVPVYLTELTLAAIPPKLFAKVETRTFTSGDILKIDDLTIKTFHIPHDAVDPVAVIASNAQRRLAIITDLGSVTQSLLSNLQDLDLLFLESNHDLTMLAEGPYPLFLKQRIRRRTGHLSNEQALEFLDRLPSNGRLKHLVLGHLSEINNHPQVVRQTFLRIAGSLAPGIQLEIASQSIPGTAFKL